MPWGEAAGASHIDDPGQGFRQETGLMVFGKRSGSSKRTRRSLLRRLVMFGLVPALIVGGFFALYPYPPLPTSDVLKARASLAEARRSVKDFGLDELTKAESLGYQMERFYAIEQSKLLRFTESKLLTGTIQETDAAARTALQVWREKRAAALTTAQERRADLEKLLKQLGTEVQFFSRDVRLRRSYSKAELAMIDARRAQSKSDVKQLSAALDRAESELGFTEQMLGNRYKRLSDPALRRQWQRWVEDTIASTRGGGAAIVVEKLGRRLVLVRNGKVVGEFDAEFGRNGLADKLHAGDGATPEGRYFVKEKRDHGNTRWYRALVINYPNAEDWQKYQQARRAGRIPGRYSIGSLIEIHGNGGKQKNWTDGCVALRNQDVDRLYTQVPVGTPVTIVGSARLPGDLAERSMRIGGTR